MVVLVTNPLLSFSPSSYKVYNWLKLVITTHLVGCSNSWNTSNPKNVSNPPKTSLPEFLKLLKLLRPRKLLKLFNFHFFKLFHFGGRYLAITSGYSAYFFSSVFCEILELLLSSKWNKKTFRWPTFSYHHSSLILTSTYFSINFFFVGTNFKALYTLLLVIRQQPLQEGWWKELFNPPTPSKKKKKKERSKKIPSKLYSLIFKRGSKIFLLSKYYFLTEYSSKIIWRAKKKIFFLHFIRNMQRALFSTSCYPSFALWMRREFRSKSTD